MKTQFPKLAISAYAILLMLTSCGPDDKQFDVVPFAEWRDYEIETIGEPQDNRKNILLKVYFNDRDGDIGTDSPSGDSCDFSSYNLLIRYFEKVGGSYREITPADSCQPFHANLPNLTPTGQNKVLEGVINSGFSYVGYPRNPGVDSIKFEVQIRDRADHLSNIAYSPAIFIPQ